MEKQFVNYEIALKLKELGFDEECLTSFTDEGELCNPWNLDFETYGCEGIIELMKNIPPIVYCKNSTNYSDYIAAPLWQQVIDWFREKHSIVITIYDNTLEKKYAFLIGKEFENKIIYASGKWLAGWSKGNTYYATYFEANKQAILKAIEIVKSK